MKTSVAGMAVQIFILFLSIIILPIYFMSIIQYYKDVNRCQIAARNFVDYVIDNRQVSESALAELNINLAAVSTPVSAEVKRETRVIDPADVANETEIKWVYTEWDENTVWYQGDLVTVEIKQESVNMLQQIAGVFLGTNYSNMDIRLVGMVR